MKTARIASLSIALTLSASAVAITVESPLSGSYWISGRTLVDAPADEPADTHFRMRLTDRTARELFTAMRVEAVYDECLDDGATSKTIGGTRCTRDAAGQEYECTLGIDIQRQIVVSGATC